MSGSINRWVGFKKNVRVVCQGGTSSSVWREKKEPIITEYSQENPGGVFVSKASRAGESEGTGMFAGSSRLHSAGVTAQWEGRGSTRDRI